MVGNQTRPNALISYYHSKNKIVTEQRKRKERRALQAHATSCLLILFARIILPLDKFWSQG